jgi:hypothetical protein
MIYAGDFFSNVALDDAKIFFEINKHQPLSFENTY